MITKIEPASNSTQLIQIFLDEVLRELASVIRLPMARFQKSIANEASPIRRMYVSLLAYLKAERLCQEHFHQLNNHKEALKERKKQVQKLLVRNNDPSLEDAFRQEFQTNANIEKDIEDLEYKLTRIHNKCKVLNKTRIQRIKNYMDQYEISRTILTKMLHDNGHDNFSENELDDAFAAACHISEAETEITETTNGQ